MHFDEFDFSRLQTGQPGTAAETVPLVLYRDQIGAASPLNVYHHRDFCSLYIVRGGRGTHVIDGTPYSVSRGDVYAMGPGMTHHFRDCENLLSDTLHFHPDIFDVAAREALSRTAGFHALFAGELTGDATALRWMHLTPSAWESVAEQVAELRAEWSRGTPDGTLLTRGLFLRLLVHLARYYAEFATPGERIETSATRSLFSREEVVAAAVRYMDANFPEPLRIEQVAALVCLSPDRFTEVFSEAMGRTPRDYLRHLRLERAKTLLTGSDHSITEIARLSGFTEAAYLTRVLRAATGLTPRAFRQSWILSKLQGG